MRPMLALVAFCLIASSLAQDTTTELYSDKLNTIEPKPSVRLDPYIRKALLKALSELEESDNTTTGSDTTDETTAYESDTFTTGVESIPETYTEKEGIQIHSFIVNGQSAFDSNSSSPTVIDSNISILSTTTGNVENQVTATLPTSASFPEIFQTKESDVNIQQTRSIVSSSKLNTDKNVTPIKSTPKPRPTTTTTTTTTTPKPTHNEDGENIEEVDKQDVQVFQAPLVAAFTVQQDSQGLPKKVIPIYQQTNDKNFVRPRPMSSPISTAMPALSVGQIVPSVNINQQLPQHDFISQQLALQRQLEEKQRFLEDQLRLLQQQQRQQEELLRKQQFLLQQKEAQRHQFLSNAAKFQAQGSVNNFQIQKHTPQNQFVSPNAVFRPNNAQVSIQPSVPIEPTNTVTNQQLPNREAVDFLIHLRNQQPGQFPLQENHLPQGISNFLQPNSNQNFHQGANFDQIRPAADQFGQPKQSHRVFRQESGVGNFGLNNQNFNSFNTFNPIQTNRFFPFNTQNQYNVDAELKQLLLQNGLNGRNQEDINIVSKVLSLNHGVSLNNHILHNRSPFDSRRQLRPFI